MTKELHPHHYHLLKERGSVRGSGTYNTTTDPTAWGSEEAELSCRFFCTGFIPCCRRLYYERPWSNSTNNYWEVPKLVICATVKR